jgi:hypothetical protein
MSRYKSREPFEAAWCSAGWVLGPFDDDSGNYEYQSTEWGWIGWQAAQSRHAAECEALVRKCAEICDSACTDVREIERGDDAYAAMTSNAVLNEVREQILALLSDSGSQG